MGQSFEGTTDAAGRLLHEEVFQGNYRLSVAIEAFEDDDPDHTVDIVDATVIVLAPDTAVPQVRMLGAVPRVVLGRLNMFFNTNKCFLLPTALPAVEKLRRLYIENAPCKLLCVGHADTRGTRDYNDRLSLERAEATVAYLRDDVEGWFKFYGTGVDTKKRWGKTEDHLMLISLPDFASKPLGEDPVRWFQRTRDLDVDGVAGSDTRHALIAEYMSLDGTSLEDFVGEIDATPHGCGENFPLDDEGDELDSAPADNKRDPFDRRLELFFFDSEYGITPRPPGSNSGPGSIEYPLWRKRATDVVELNADNAGPRLAFVEFADAHFRTDSAVVLPNGTPADDTHEAGITTPGLVANVLRFNEDHGGLTLVVTGHTDTTADAGHNDKLSRERASAALALLEGNRDEFASLANGRHKPADINQILTWISDDLSELGIDCKPASIEGSVDASKVRTFQSGYNINKATLNSASADLAVDGSVGLQTWGAFFDCYEFALRRSLGEDAQGVDDLRGKLLFVDPGRKALGFGERFPIEELGVDNFRSQTNRRVEVLFFEPGEAPDLADSEDDPDTSVLYLPGHFARVPVAAAPDATRGPNIELRVIVDSEAPYTDSDQLVVSNAAGQVLLQVTLGTGQAEANARRFSFVELVKGDRYRAVVKVSPQDFVLFDQTLSNSPPVLL